MKDRRFIKYFFSSQAISKIVIQKKSVLKGNISL
jgi:hypothetical protein